MSIRENLAKNKRRKTEKGMARRRRAIPKNTHYGKTGYPYL